MAISSNNKRIAKNTVMLYIRLFITMIITLYTSRVILDVLGVSDFGLYNVICGTVTLFSFMNGSMAGCTQRFLSIALGKEDVELSKKTFSVALLLQLATILIFVLILEVGGVYLINHVLNVPADRVPIAGLLFHISILTFTVSFLRLPFEAAIISHEKMDFYAYLSIFDVCSKLGVVYLLKILPGYDSLILYSYLLLLVELLLFAIYSGYTVKKIEMCSFRLSRDKILLKEMSTYTFWNLLGHVSYLISTQGYNIIFNIFLGTSINAARAISIQVNGVIQKFTNNFQLAYTPQIIKLYAANEISEMQKLVMNSSKYTCYLVILLGIPLFIVIDTILDVWLTKVPTNTNLFIRVLLIQTFFSSLDVALDRAVIATGKVKSMNIFNTTNQMFFLGFSYLLLSFGVRIEFVIPVMILPSIVLFLYTLYLCHKYIYINYSQYFRYVLLNCLMVTVFSFLPPYILSTLFKSKDIYTAIIVCICSGLFSIMAFYIGAGSEMRNIVKQRIIKLYR